MTITNLPEHIVERGLKIAATIAQDKAAGMQALWDMSKLIDELPEASVEGHMHTLATRLSRELGAGYSVASLYQIRRVYDFFKEAEFDSIKLLPGISATKVRDTLDNKAIRRKGRKWVTRFLSENSELSSRRIIEKVRDIARNHRTNSVVE